MKSFTTGLLLTLTLFSFLFNPVKAQTNIEDEYQMKQYFMVFLKAGSNRT